jgi:hypothetical protein
MVGPRGHNTVYIGEQQLLQLLDSAVVVCPLSTHIANSSRHAVHHQQVVAVPLDVGHRPALESAGVAIWAYGNGHNTSQSSTQIRLSSTRQIPIETELSQTWEHHVK